LRVAGKTQYQVIELAKVKKKKATK
jgi:hypothetical protein